MTNFFSCEVPSMLRVKWQNSLQRVIGRVEAYAMQGTFGTNTLPSAESFSTLTIMLHWTLSSAGRRTAAWYASLSPSQRRLNPRGLGSLGFLVPVILPMTRPEVW